MATLSPKIKFRDEQKLKNTNPETLALWKKYEIDMSLRELSEKSKAGYRNDMEHFWIYVYDNYDNIPASEVKEDIVESFLYYCRTQGNNSRRIKRRLSTISAFYKFLRRKKLVNDNPCEFIERSKKDVDVAVQTYLSEEQVESIKKRLTREIDNASTSTQKHSWMMLLTYAMFSLSTMARVSAVSSVKWEQIDFENRFVSDVIEKEGYVVDLFFSDYVRELLVSLRRFREGNNISDSGFVFSYGDEPVTTSTMNQWCKKIGNMISIPTLHPHDFRHSGSQIMKLRGASLEEISEALNHKGVEVTRKHYLKTDKNKVRESRDKFGL